MLKVKKQEKISNNYYLYAGFPYLDRDELILTLETNIDENIVLGQSNGFNVIDETLFLGEVQGLSLPLEEGITASERLRRRMFVYWKKKVNKGDFETWRKQQMEMLGERYLEKLE